MNIGQLAAAILCHLSLSMGLPSESFLLLPKSSLAAQYDAGNNVANIHIHTYSSDYRRQKGNTNKCANRYESLPTHIRRKLSNCTAIHNTRENALSCDVCVIRRYAQSNKREKRRKQNTETRQSLEIAAEQWNYKYVHMSNVYL